MEKLTLAGSPNWYLSQVFDCSWDNKVAYGTLSSLVIIEPSLSLNPATISHAHSARILSVSFSPQGFGNRLLSTSEAGEAFIWDLVSRKVSLAFKSSQKCALFGSWSHANGNLVVCVDENGNLMKWKIDSNKCSVKSFREHTFVVVACSPHDADLVATGTRQGLVCVINIKVSGKEFVLHKLRGHDSEVVSLSWCPVRENVINPKNESNCLLLASGAKEKKIFFWRAGQDGLYEAFVDTPLVPRTQPGTKQWTCVSWYEPQQLLVSTVGGEVLTINVSKLKAKKTEKCVKWDQFSDYHNRCHVVVKSSPWRINGEIGEEDWRMKDTVPRWVWTFGSDRIVAGICSDKRTANIKLNTIGGPVHALAISPIDGTSLAIGVADKSIRVVNLSEPQLKTMQTFNQKVSGKVMSLSWHPSKDGWLAYGTSDGRIGIQFTCSVKPPLLFRPFSKDSIYKLEWGPTLASIKSKFEPPEVLEGEEKEVKWSRYVLYAIGGGRIAAMDSNNPDHIFEEPFKDILKSIPRPESLKSKNKVVGMTDLAWKPDFSLLALGDESGSIHLLNLTEKEELYLLATCKVHVTLIQDLSWHPQSCFSDTTDVSPQVHWLATASNDVNIRVLDTASIFEAIQSLGDGSSLPMSNIPCIATLKGHKLRVSKVAWSPHEGGRLLSVSYDQCAQVWDVVNRQPVACYTLHTAPLFSCVWSPFNPSLAITAGMEAIISIWDVQEQQSKLPISKGKDGPNLMEEAKDACHVHVETGKGENQSLNPKSKKKEKAALPLSGPEIQNEESNLTILKYLLKPSDNTHFKFNVDEVGANAKSLPLHYAFFGNESEVQQYLLKESKSGLTSELSFTLDVWRGSPKDTILEAIQTKTLTSYMISLAPTVSHKMWVEACSAYAEQLKETGEFSKASAYLLAIHKHEEAIKLLAENGKFRYAVAIARCRLPADSPLTQALLIDWAQECLNQGQQCLAAVCFASGGEWSKAAQCLALKKTPNRLLLAAQIMKDKSPGQAEGAFYARECFDVALSLKEWPTAQNVLNLYPSLNHLSLHLHIHEALCTDSTKPEDWLKLGTDSKNIAELEEDTLKVTISLSDEKVSALLSDFTNEFTVNSEDAAWLAASGKVTQAYLAAPDLFPKIKEKFVIESITSSQQDFQAAYRHLIQAMALLFHFHITHALNSSGAPMFLKLCIWISPQGPLHTGSLFASCCSPLQSSLRAYLAAGLLLWMQKLDSAAHVLGALALETVDILKEDIFTSDALKSFKVEFKLKLLQESKGSQLLADKKTGDAVDSVKGIENNKVNGDTAVDNATENLETLNDSTAMDKEERIKSTLSDEVHVLTSWTKNFTDMREKVPNPYLCYSALVQYLKCNNLTDQIEKYGTLWDEINKSVDV